MADTIKQEFLDQVLHATAGFVIVFVLGTAVNPWLVFGIVMLLAFVRESAQHRSVRLGFGSALDLFCTALGATIGALL